MAYKCPNCGSKIPAKVLIIKNVTCKACDSVLQARPVSGLLGFAAGGLIYKGVEGNPLLLAVGGFFLGVTLLLVSLFPGIRVVGNHRN